MKVVKKDFNSQHLCRQYLKEYLLEVEDTVIK